MASPRQLAWRACYELLAARVRSPQWAFMDYGYLDPRAPRPVLDARDEADRLCIQLYEHVVAAADLRGAHVLEVGSGRGGGASYLARYHHPAAVTGLDLSARAVALSSRHRRAPGLSFVRGDALALPFPAASFDAVVNVESSHCYDSVPRFLAEVHRVLRPGGRLLFADLRTGRAVEELVGELRGCALALERCEDITGQVLAALRADSERKQALIDALLPRAVHRPFRSFAGIDGTRSVEAFATGHRRYLSAVLVR